MSKYTTQQYVEAGFPEGRDASEAVYGPEYVARKMAAKYSQPQQPESPNVYEGSNRVIQESTITVPSLDEVAAYHAACTTPQSVPVAPVPVKLRKTSLFDEELFRKYVPVEMMAECRWVRFFLKNKEGGGTAKIPLGARLGERGDHADESTWGTFNECVKNLENDQQGIGYVLTGGDIHCLDIDHCCKKDGIPCNEAMFLLSRLGSWSEYSVSGQGIHVFFKGNVRGKQLSETCLQFWHPKKAPRFIALTCNMIGEAFTTLRDIGDDFNYVFATARHVSAKIREELKTLDREQWESLPVEREPVEPVTKEKGKHKTRKIVAGFDIKDFLQFYSIPIDNECDNEIGHCIRVASCPIKGEPHAGHNSTTCNFIYPTKDGGFAFHCNSTGCAEYGVGDVIKKLAEEKESYPNPIYEKKQQSEIGLVYSLQSLNDVKETSLSWLWNGFLPDNQLVHFVGASSEGKSPVSLDLIARTTTGKAWPDGTPNTLGPRSVILMAGEDDLSDTVIPRLRMAGADISKVHIFKVTARRDDKETLLSAAIDRDYQGLVDTVRSLDDLALIVLDPITNSQVKECPQEPFG